MWVGDVWRLVEVVRGLQWWRGSGGDAVISFAGNDIIMH